MMSSTPFTDRIDVRAITAAYYAALGIAAANANRPSRERLGGAWALGLAACDYSAVDRVCAMINCCTHEIKGFFTIGQIIEEEKRIRKVKFDQYEWYDLITDAHRASSLPEFLGAVEALRVYEQKQKQHGSRAGDRM